MTEGLFTAMVLAWSIAGIWLLVVMARNGLTIKKVLTDFYKIVVKEMEGFTRSVRTREAFQQVSYHLTIGDQLYQVDTEYNRAKLYGQLIDVVDDRLVIELQGTGMEVKLHILDYGDQIMALAKAEAIVRKRSLANRVQNEQQQIAREVSYVKTLISNDGAN